MTKIINSYKKALMTGVMFFVTTLCFASSPVNYDMPAVSPDDYTENISLARQGDGTAARIVGDCFLTGKGVDRDVNQAWKWYAQAAGKVDNEARYRIAVLYSEGNGVRQSDEEAAYWFGRAAKNGHPLALLHLADCYATGEDL